MGHSQVWMRVTRIGDSMSETHDIGGARLVMSDLTEAQARKLADNLAEEIRDVIRITDGDRLTVSTWVE